MWLILPDEGISVDEILTSSEYLSLTLDPEQWENKTKLTINLSLPKFDISSQADLIEGLQSLGLSDIFSPGIADFSPMTDTEELAVGKIDHAVRVTIDEDGVIGAAYTVVDMPECSDPPLPPDEMDFVLDRPFLFLVTGDVPLFAGVVEQP